MKLKEKTHRKFVEFFTEKSRANQEKEFEIAFSEIQRSTGTASVTLKRALSKLVEDGFIEMVPGRNSRYARFIVVSAQGNKPDSNTPEQVKHEKIEISVGTLEQDIDLLKRRLRSQEISIALLQERLADLEEKIKHC